jgi:alanine racemase
MHRSEITVDLGAVRRNVRTLLRALDGTELWAVVKANGYGHGAVDVARAALGAGATALCVATVPEALQLRPEFGGARILVMGPTTAPERHARHGSSSWSRTAASPKAYLSTSSSTREWAATAWRSCPSHRRRSWG